MVDEPEPDEPHYMGLIRSTGEFSAYPPIADYGFLSDCEVTALVAPSGALEWMCLPRMDCPSVFGAILDRRAGSFRFGPENVDVPADRRYLPGTMVLETSWDCGEGWIVERKRRRFDTAARLIDQERGDVLAKATAIYVAAPTAQEAALRERYGVRRIDAEAPA